RRAATAQSRGRALPEPLNAPRPRLGASGGRVMYPSAAATAAAITDPAPGRDMRSLLPCELSRWVAAPGPPAYRGEQIFRWLHGRDVQAVGEMTNVPPT